MGLLKMLGLVRLSEYEAACKARDTLGRELDASTAALKHNSDWLDAVVMDNKLASDRIADLVEQNDRLVAAVRQLSEALERRGHPLSWPTITDPDEPSTVSTLAVDIDPRFAAAAYEHDLKVAGHG